MHAFTKILIRLHPTLSQPWNYYFKMNIHCCHCIFLIFSYQDHYDELWYPVCTVHACSQCCGSVLRLSDPVPTSKYKILHLLKWNFPKSPSVGPSVIISQVGGESHMLLSENLFITYTIYRGFLRKNNRTSFNGNPVPNLQKDGRCWEWRRAEGCVVQPGAPVLLDPRPLHRQGGQANVLFLTLELVKQAGIGGENMRLDGWTRTKKSREPLASKWTFNLRREVGALF